MAPVGSVPKRLH